MKRRGINPKSWFYGLRDVLIAEQNRPCVIAGSACEQWINGELFRVIAKGLDCTNLTAYPEWNRRQHDIAVLPHRPENPKAWYSPVAVVESKVLYPNYSKKKREKYLDRLLEQVSASHSNSPSRVGFLFGIYTNWPEYGPPLKESFADFRQAVGTLLRDRVNKGISGFSIRMDHGGAMETLIQKTETRIGGAEVVVGCVAQYFRLVEE